MSSTGTRIHSGRDARLVRNTPAEPISPGETPFRLLWSTGIIALVLGIAAFVLWGINGAVTLFDMMAALCT